MGSGMEAGKGAVGGAMGGAAMGAQIGGPWGAAIGGIGGGILGGIGGFFGGDNGAAEHKRRLDYQYNLANGQQAPQLGAASTSGVSDFRGDQRDLVNRLTALSRGEGPSLAAQQFRSSTDQNIAAQQSQAQSGRGGPLAAFNAANNMAMLGNQAAQGTALARTNEQMQAIGQLGGVIGQGRGQDEGNNQFNAQQQNFRDQANLEAMLRQRNLNNTHIQSMLGMTGGQAAQPGMGTGLLAGGAGQLALLASQGPKPQQGWSNGQSSGYKG